ncbi:MAG: hypothetical protein V1776_01720 [Candidatus Diapherotrites archaeon]
MSYEIPKNLQYTEKIVFNLGFEQALWVGLFGILTFTVFFKLPIIFEARIGISLILVALGAGFAFFDFRTYATNIFSFLSIPRKIGYLDHKMKQFVEINRIENDSVYLQNGSIKAIIQIQPINFHILSIKQKQAIISAYKDFLNSLDFPIQIVMRTVNLNLDEYLSQLEIKVRQQKKPPLLNQFTDFQEFMRKYIEENSVKNRLFYIVIPFTPSKNPLGTKTNPLEQIQIRVSLCQEKLKNCNLITKRLSTNELVFLMASYFEGFIEAENEYQKIVTVKQNVLL